MTGRVALLGERLNTGAHVSGVSLAVLGQTLPSGEFLVEDTCYAGLLQQTVCATLCCVLTHSLSRTLMRNYSHTITHSLPLPGSFFFFPWRLQPRPKLPVGYVCLISGLNLKSNDTARLPLQLFADFVQGNLGGSGDQQLAARIMHVIVAGNMVRVCLLTLACLLTSADSNLSFALRGVSLSLSLSLSLCFIAFSCITSMMSIRICRSTRRGT